MDTTERLSPTNITDIMQTAYIDYSMSVIVSRALPDARDGLKPVQRRVLYAMLREGLRHNTAYDKCAGVVGEVLKNYHPHGDSSVYDTLVRLTQDWVMRYPLVDGQGNFGSIEGDSAAAYRYTECRLQELSEDLLRDIDEDTVDFQPNYKESTTEPSVLPSALPNLLLNGSTGIAVGMATNIPPHNLGELVEVCCRLIDNPMLSFDEIEEIIKGPDFPTGGCICGTDGIKQYLRTGRGIVKVRGIAHIEEIKNGFEQIVITEIPYNVNREALVKRIAELVNEKVLPEVRDLRNESDANTRIVIELKRGESERVVMNKLYKHTALESSFGAILLALDHTRPKQMNIREMLECFIEHRRDVITRRTRFRLRKAEARAHILEGFKIAYRNLDDFVHIIRSSKDRDEAAQKLMAKYGLSEIQVKAILDMRLYQLTGLEIDKIEAEYIELMGYIDECREILSNEKKLLELVKTELRAMGEKYASPRKTEIRPAEGEFRPEDVIPNEGCMISVSHEGFIKRTSLDLYRTQKRGGKGLIGSETHNEDFIEYLFSAKTHDTIMFFTNKGRVYVQKAYEIPEGSRTSKGRSIVNVIEMQEGEKLATLLCIPEFTDTKNVFFCTKNGVVKKTTLSEYKNCNRRGIIAINLREGDDLISVKLTNGNDQVILITENGMTIRFDETDARNLGRSAAGVTGMKLREGDSVVAMEVVDPACTLLIAGKNGIGKRTQYDDEEGEVFRKQNRGGVGVIGIKNKSGVAGALSVLDSDQVMLLTKGGQAIRMPVKGIRRTGRAAQGVKLMDIDTKAGEEVIGICKVITGDDETDAVAPIPTVG
ncbi:MAG: DNA gyrase subunit A [Opitutales bacterium]|nr:DNA gyrase subunit A [Opitutales bacterium]